MVEVIDPQGHSHQAIAWAAKLVVLAVACQAKLNATEHGQLVIDYGPKGMILTFRGEWARTP